MLLAPVFLIVAYPCHFLVNKVSHGSKKFNSIVCSVMYGPVFLVQVALFMVLNMALIPFAYFTGIY